MIIHLFLHMINDIPNVFLNFIKILNVQQYHRNDFGNFNSMLALIHYHMKIFQN